MIFERCAECGAVPHAVWCSRYTEPEDTEMAKKQSKNGGIKIPPGSHVLKLELPCQLDQEEIATKSQKAARENREANELQEEIAASLKGKREQLKAKRGTVQTLLDEVNTGTEVRTITCYEEKDYKQNVVRTIRVDTGEEVKDKTRALDPEERQEELKPRGKGRKRSASPPDGATPDQDGGEQPTADA